MTPFRTLTLIVLLILPACAPEKPAITGSGVIEATEVLVSPAITGDILALPVHEGDPVTAGQELARIDSEQLQLERQAVAATLDEIAAGTIQADAQIAQATTALAGARKSFERAEALKAKGSISNQNYDDADTAYKLAQRQLDTARTALNVLEARKHSTEARLNVLDYQIREAIITAPIDGIVIETFQDAGERAMPGKPMLKIADLKDVWVKIYIDHADMGTVKIGADARILIDSQPGMPVTGRVTWIASSAEFTPKNVQTRNARADLVYAVKITAANPDGVLKIGMPVDVLVAGFPEYRK